MHTLYQIKDKMRTILAIVVISCFFAVATSQFSFDCATRLADLGNCITRLGTATQGQTDFCNECGNPLVSYYRDCHAANGVGVDTVQAGI